PLKVYCGGDYDNISASNIECVTTMNTYIEMFLQITVLDIFELNFKLTKPRKFEGISSLADLDPCRYSSYRSQKRKCKL
ncbi:hypothetical protein Ddye_021303, partial [Dipteronia dyeriana]